MKRILQERRKAGARLDEYVRHLHKVQPCGYSLHDLIDLYEAVGPVNHVINFDIDLVDGIPETDTRRHLGAISKLTAAGSAISDFNNNSLRGVGLAEYSAEVRRQVQPALNDCVTALEKVISSAAPVSARIGSEAPAAIGELGELREMIRVFRQGTETEPLVLQILRHDAGAALAYYDRKEGLEREAQQLLSTWQAEFLSADVQSWRERHAAAGRRFFGKASAMAGVVSELQSHANVPLTYEQIPGAFWMHSNSIRSGWKPLRAIGRHCRRKRMH